MFEREGASVPLVDAWWAVAEVHLFRCEFERMRAAVEHGMEAARAASREERARMHSAVGLSAMLGPTPVPEGLRLCGQGLGPGVWHEPENGALPKPGDLYWLRYPKTPKIDSVAHVGIVCKTGEESWTRCAPWST